MSWSARRCRPRRTGWKASATAAVAASATQSLEAHRPPRLWPMPVTTSKYPAVMKAARVNSTIALLMIRSMSYRRYLKIATPAATGTAAPPTATAAWPHGWASPYRKMPAALIAAATASSIAAVTNQRSCRRSSPLARRSRSTRAEAQARIRVSRAALRTLSATEMNRFGAAVCWPGTAAPGGPFSAARASPRATSTSPVAHATGRQRRDGSRPSGKRSSRKVNKGAQPICTTTTSQFISCPAGSDPGATSSARPE